MLVSSCLIRRRCRHRRWSLSPSSRARPSSPLTTRSCSARTRRPAHSVPPLSTCRQAIIAELWTGPNGPISWELPRRQIYGFGRASDRRTTSIYTRNCAWSDSLSMLDVYRIRRSKNRFFSLDLFMPTDRSSVFPFVWCAPLELHADSAIDPVRAT